MASCLDTADGSKLNYDTPIRHGSKLNYDTPIRHGHWSWASVTVVLKEF